MNAINQKLLYLYNIIGFFVFSFVVNYAIAPYDSSYFIFVVDITYTACAVIISCLIYFLFIYFNFPYIKKFYGVILSILLGASLFNVISPATTRTDAPSKNVERRLRHYIETRYPGEKYSFYNASYAREPFHFMRFTKWHVYLKIFNKDMNGYKGPEHELIIDKYLFYLSIHEIS